MMLKIVGLLVIAFSAQALAKSRLTPLRIDNYPCKPEVLKKQVRYICDSRGNITCNHGWTKDNDTDHLHPCITPVCKAGCVHGKCKSPDTCACEIGWEGNDCNKCVTLPGCLHGSCNGTALACACYNSTQWSGGLCDIPVCDNCVHGHCIEPGVCKCNPGWTGTNCTDCVPLKGCSPIGGYCKDPNNPTKQTPHGCICKTDYTGPLCDQPKCVPTCTKGQGACVFARTNMTEPVCKCKLGYQGQNCGLCIEYPDCPKNANAGGCKNPYECLCDAGDQNPLCDIHKRMN